MYQYKTITLTDEDLETGLSTLNSELLLNGGRVVPGIIFDDNSILIEYVFEPDNELLYSNAR